MTSATPHPELPVLGTHRRPWPTLLSWVAIVVVSALILVLIGVKIIRSETEPGIDPVALASPAVVATLGKVPVSAYKAALANPSPLIAHLHRRGGSLMTATTVSGMTLPLVVFVGTESCMACAAERWPLIVALSRFGTFSNLGAVTSSDLVASPSLQSFTFRGSKYRSNYFILHAFELTGERPDELGNYPVTASLDPQAAAAIHDDDVVAASGLVAQPGGFKPEQMYPFLDLAHRAVLVGTQLPPAVLIGRARADVADALSDPTTQVSGPILTAANALTVELCAITHGLPAKVCRAYGGS